MKRTALEIPYEYTAALEARFGFDLSQASLATRAGKAFTLHHATFVSKINEGLTKNRESFFADGYLQNKEMREAYLLYYMTTNLLKVIPPLRELSHSHFFQDNTPLNILDLGTGTGAAAWGILSYLNEEAMQNQIEIILSDSLQENLIEAEFFFRYFIPKLKIAPSLQFERYDLRKPEIISNSLKNSAPYHLIMMMNVLNELDEANDLNLYKVLMSLLDDSGALLLIEPATRIESRRLLRFRDLAVNNGATIYSPCTRQANCPALIKENDWCHTEIPWKRPAFIKAIDDITGTLRLSLKSSYMIIRKDGIVLEDALQEKDLYRVVSERFDEKGRTRSILCGENGRNEHIINKRDRTTSNKEFMNIERYDVVKLQDQEFREHDIKVAKESKFSIVLPNLGAH